MIGFWPSIKGYANTMQRVNILQNIMSALKFIKGVHNVKLFYV